MDIIFPLQDIQSVAAMLYENSGDKNVWAFHAAMGSGKTTLIIEVCKLLGVTQAMSSPTFSIVNEYQTTHSRTVYHIDVYRLRDEEEAICAGVEDILQSGNLCFVEWANSIPNLLSNNTLHIYMEVVDVNTRRIYTVQ